MRPPTRLSEALDYDAVAVTFVCPCCSRASNMMVPRDIKAGEVIGLALPPDPATTECPWLCTGGPIYCIFCGAAYVDISAKREHLPGCPWPREHKNEATD